MDSLKKNTILVQFLNIDHNPNSKNWFHYEVPLKDKIYRFFVTPEQRKHLELGLIVQSKNPQNNWHLSSDAVIVGNVTERNSKLKHRQIDKITGKTLKPFIHKYYHNNYFADLAVKKYQKTVQKLLK